LAIKATGVGLATTVAVDRTPPHLEGEDRDVSAEWRTRRL